MSSFFQQTTQSMIAKHIDRPPVEVGAGYPYPDGDVAWETVV
ncbi:hypothetical protein [Neisseria mucosa]|nr:hypothetical protein [Neisseria mucosa]